jgi:pyruvate dehydrogenase E1 component
MGSIFGHRMRNLGVDHFGQSGSLPDLYRHHGIDTGAILRAVQSLTPGRPIVV